MVSRARPAPHRRSTPRSLALVLATTIAVGTGCLSGEAARDTQEASAGAAATIGGSATTTRPVSSPPATTTTTTTIPVTQPAVLPGTVLVTRIIDGDTVEIEGGARVRLIGIDTPERGECGFREANDHLAALILLRRVVLVPGARQDVDRYDRLLRYIDLDGRDINLTMIADGFAIARYDSRDGYGRHTREDAYIAADANSAPAILC